MAKEWFTVQELAGMPGMAGTERGTLKAMKIFLHLARRKLRGKGFEFPFECLPSETQVHIQNQAITAAFTSQRLEARYHQERLALGRTGAVPAALPQAVQDDILAQATAHYADRRPSRPAKPAKSTAVQVSPAAKPQAKPKEPGTALTVRQAGGVQADGSCIKNGQVRRVKTQIGDIDRAFQDAALLLMLALDEAMQHSGTSARKSARVLATSIMNASAAPALQQAAATVYIKPRGVQHLGGLDALTARLQKMHGFYQEGCKQATPAAFLIAGRPEKRGPKPEHLRAFLHFYCLPNRPNVAQAWNNAKDWYVQQGIERPAVDSWYRIEKDLPVTTKYRGRMTGSAWKSLLPYVRPVPTANTTPSSTAPKTPALPTTRLSATVTAHKARNAPKATAGPATPSCRSKAKMSRNSRSSAPRCQRRLGVTWKTTLPKSRLPRKKATARAPTKYHSPCQN